MDASRFRALCVVGLTVLGLLLMFVMRVLGVSVDSNAVPCVLIGVALGMGIAPSESHILEPKVLAVSK